MRILLVEDEPTLRAQLHAGLAEAGHVVEQADNGRDAHFMGESEDFDAVVLDLGLPLMDGLTVLQRWREQGRSMPVLILTARDNWHDKVAGIDAGADDYLTKPFSMEVLVARMEAILRRSHSDKSVPSLAEEIVLGNYTYVPGKMRLSIGDTELKFTPKENELMKLLCENLGRPVSRSYALKLIWGDDTYFNARSMDVYMTKLRKMLKEDPRVQLLNLHGEGFRLSVEGL